MSSTVSSEKPQALLVRQIAERMREVKGEGGRILWVAGPAVVHTGAAPPMVALVEHGWVDVLFSGNALATHDIESVAVRHVARRRPHRGRRRRARPRAPHPRDQHDPRRRVDQGRRSTPACCTGGVMHAMVEAGKPFVLVGSVRDDGPLPDVYTDVIEGQRAMRAQLPGVGFAIMVATMLHSIATGNILPASVPLVAVDINPATVTKLADRGSAQAIGIVTDIGLFLEQLAHELVPGYTRRPRPVRRHATAPRRLLPEYGEHRPVVAGALDARRGRRLAGHDGQRSGRRRSASIRRRGLDRGRRRCRRRIPATAKQSCSSSGEVAEDRAGRALVEVTAERRVGASAGSAASSAGRCRCRSVGVGADRCVDATHHARAAER